MLFVMVLSQRLADLPGFETQVYSSGEDFEDPECHQRRGSNLHRSLKPVSGSVRPAAEQVLAGSINVSKDMAGKVTDAARNENILLWGDQGHLRQDST